MVIGRGGEDEVRGNSEEVRSVVGEGLPHPPRKAKKAGASLIKSRLKPLLIICSTSWNLSNDYLESFSVKHFARIDSATSLIDILFVSILHPWMCLSKAAKHLSICFSAQDSFSSPR